MLCVLDPLNGRPGWAPCLVGVKIATFNQLDLSMSGGTMIVNPLVLLLLVATQARRQKFSREVPVRLA